MRVYQRDGSQGARRRFAVHGRSDRAPAIPLFGGPLEGGWHRAARLEGEEPHIEWNASFHKDRLGVRPDLIEAAVEIPGNEDDIETLFLRMTGEGVVPDEDEGGVLIAP